MTIITPDIPADYIGSRLRRLSGSRSFQCLTCFRWQSTKDMLPRGWVILQVPEIQRNVYYCTKCKLERYGKD